MKNSEFTASATIIYDLSKKTIKNHKHISSNALNTLGELIQQISNFAPTQRPHELTQTINIAHTKRKKQLTGIRQYIKAIVLAPEIFPPQYVDAALRLQDWLQNIYGTRHYDMGIGKFTAKMDTMFLLLDNDIELMNAFKLCSHPRALEELRQSQKIVVNAIIQRDIDLGERELEPGFTILRMEIYKHIRVFVRFIEAKILFNINKDTMMNAKHMLYSYINPKQANYKQQATKRQRALYANYMPVSVINN